MVTPMPGWIMRDYVRCSGCRMCEVACSLHHEGRIWPEASRVRVFALVPGTDFPHLCCQCDDYPCVNACPIKGAISIDKRTEAVVVNKELCTGCGACIRACPGRVPHRHPREKHVLICDLCWGDPECVKVCTEAGYDALRLVPKSPSPNYKLYARLPEEVAKELSITMYGEKGEELT